MQNTNETFTWLRHFLVTFDLSFGFRRNSRCNLLSMALKIYIRTIFIYFFSFKDETLAVYGVAILQFMSFY